jgi:hypothetical protein
VHYWKTLIGIAGQVNAKQSEERITFTTTFDEPVFTEVKGYDVIAIPDCGYTERIGDPKLPVKVFAVLLPPKTDIDSVEVTPVATAPLVGTYTIYPVQPPAIAQNYTEFVEPNETVYSAASPYPAEIYEDAEVGSLRGYRLARIRLYPIQYTPATGELTFHKTIHVEIKTVLTSEAEVEFESSIVALSGSNPELDRWIGSNTVNPEMTQSYKEELPITSVGGLVIASEERYDYLIITRDTFLPHITALKNKKAAAGLKVKVETVDDIVNKYPGANVPEKIRNCIQNYYALSGVKWVVLIGDTDSDDIDDNNPSLDKNWEVPTRYMWNDDTTNPGDYSPSDYYYAGLNGNWDANGNGKYGESSVVSGIGIDEADWYPEVFVGRITAQSITQLQNQMTKIQNFPGFGSISDMLLCGAEMDASTDDKQQKQLIRDNYVPLGITCREYYQSDGTLTEANVISAINTYDPEVANSASHGSYTGLVGYYGPYFFTTTTPASLTNSPPYLWYADACLSNGFDRSGGDCLGEAMMHDSDGSAIAYVGAMRVSWYWVGYPAHLLGLNGLMDLLYWEEFFVHNDKNPGATLYMSKVSYLASAYGGPDLTQEYERKNLFTYMLLGDPHSFTPGDKLIIQDNNPWGVTANQDCVNEEGYYYQITNSSQLMVTDLSEYGLVIISGDQSEAFYDTMIKVENQVKFREYVSNGGVLIMGADLGWAGGRWDMSFLPGAPDLGHISACYDDMTVVDPNHPIVTGPYGVLTDAEIDGWYCSSHGYFTDIPDNAHVIIGEASNPTGHPTLIEWNYGKGKVIASMHTTEWGYAEKNKKVMLRNLVAYAQVKTTLYFPDFTDTNNPSSWRSWFVIQNPSASTANIDIELWSRSGTLLYSGSSTIPAHGASAIRPRNLVGSDCAGNAIISSDQQIMGTCQINRNNNDMCMSYTAFSEGSSTLYYPDFTDTNDPSSWRSWFVIQNPSASTANIDIELRSRSGTLLYSGSSTIPAHGASAIRPRNLAGWDCAGTAIISSDQRIMGTCQINRNNNDMCMSYRALLQ